MQAEVPPQMIEIDAVGAIAILQLKRSITPCRPRRGRGRAPGRASGYASSTWARICRKILRFHDLGHRPFEREAARLEEGVEAHHAEADRALALGAEYLARAISSGARSI